MRPIAYMTGWAVAFWFAVAVAALGQEIGGLSSVPTLTEARFPVRGLSVPEGSLDDLSKWASKLVVSVDAPDDSTPSIEVDIGLARRQPVLYFSADKPGLYVLLVVDVTAAKPVIVSKRVQVGEPQPNPPQPGPGPVVPVPVNPPPIPLSGLRVLVIYETDPATDKPKLTRDQAAIVTGAETRAMLTSRCAKDAKGSPEFRFFDEDVDTSNAAEHWRDAMRRPRKSLPWLIVSDGVKGFEGPLPADAKAFAELLKGFGQ